MGRRSRARSAAMGALVLAVFLALLALGTWQLQRRVWKLQLIHAVATRLHRPATPAPGPAKWPTVTAERDAYRKVRVCGVFDNSRETLVLALTDLGSGFWVLTPLKTDAGFTVLINRGFVPDERRDALSRQSSQLKGPTTITGLMRISEPGGGFLRRNDPAGHLWYSRDVSAIGRAKNLSTLAPYFIDADAQPNPGGWPVGGLTIVNFPNSHLAYALTWYGMAALLAWACITLAWPRRHAWLKGKDPRPHDRAEPERHHEHPVSVLNAARGCPALIARLAFQRAFADDDTSRNNLLQLVQLRWIAVAGQVITIAVATLVFQVTLPLIAMGAVLAALVGMNAASLIRLRSARRIDNGELFLALILDMAALTVQLYCSGGAANPFISLYLLQIILGAVLLEPWSIWALVTLTGICFAALTQTFLPLSIPGRSPAELLSLHSQGAFICFLLDSGLLVVFVERISRNLRLRDVGLANLKQQAAEEDHIVRMGLLASGAAHELGTPLATLSVILNDWRRMPQFAADPQLSEEIADMEGEVRRCKTILSGILLSAGETRGEAPMVVSVETFLDDVLEDWRGLHPSTGLDYLSAVDNEILIVSDAALRQAVFNVLENAAEASPDWVGLSAHLEAGMIVLRIRDKGAGFGAEVLANVGKPYNSTKGREGGGLGLFLVTNVVRKLGGSVTAANAISGGAAVTLALPLAALQIRGAKQ